MYKRELWGMAAPVREQIGRALEDKFTFLLKQLNVSGTRALAERFAPLVAGSEPDLGTGVGVGKAEDVTGLSD
jgi:hypothetical protein